jgi:hypothetical protein
MQVNQEVRRITRVAGAGDGSWFSLALQGCSRGGGDSGGDSGRETAAGTRRSLTPGPLKVEVEAVMGARSAAVPDRE